ncbi:cAMP-dependent protein kinase inhibitor gamma isoform X1 [Podarcis raffonei]|uniref:cAMP-dependent protein kinase inhibitor gamma isoform X1 n=2 Tax=Podarcis raffonei TaxID=65483 RepID=UPI0023296364|nr:cAMP-dependent protein kinase inhibitor gamma isoform X1 [Podarcis raffonei]
MLFPIPLRCSKSRTVEPASLTFGMAEKKKVTLLKQCQKCLIDMNGDMLDAQGICLHCKAEEQQKNQKGKRDPASYNVNETMETEPAYSDFISCDRSGRRNAIPDLQGDAAALKLEKLASTMEDIAIAGDENQDSADATEKESGLTPKSEDGSPTL